MKFLYIIPKFLVITTVLAQQVPTYETEIFDRGAKFDNSEFKDLSFEYTWKIYNFSKIYASPGQYLISPGLIAVEAPEIKWHLLLYPRGLKKEYSEYLSMFLNYRCQTVDAIKTSARFSLLTQDYKETNVEEFEQNINWRGYGWPQYIARNSIFDNSSRLLHNGDTLVVHVQFSATLDKKTLRQHCRKQKPCPTLPPPTKAPKCPEPKKCPICKLCPTCATCPTCPAPIKCPKPKICPTCPTTPKPITCPTTPKPKVCPTCPTCPTTPKPKICPICPTTPKPITCPTTPKPKVCPICPKPKICPTCPTTPKPVTCPTTPKPKVCPTCPICPVCPTTPKPKICPICPTCPTTPKPIICPTTPKPKVCPTCPTCPTTPKPTICPTPPKPKVCPVCPTIAPKIDSRSSSKPVRKSDELVQKLHTFLKKVYTTGDYSDVLMIVDNKEIHAHRLVLAAQSATFADMFDTADISGYGPSAIEIRNIDFKTMNAVIHYLYTNEVNPEGLRMELLREAARYLKIEGLVKITTELLLQGTETE